MINEQQIGIMNKTEKYKQKQRTKVKDTRTTFLKKKKLAAIAMKQREDNLKGEAPKQSKKVKLNHHAKTIL